MFIKKKQIAPTLLSEKIYSDDLFLVTFPKSGTTWLSYLLANVFIASNGIDSEI